jgi:xyloglucan-specific endo-beta-1,4-glucanase
MYRRFLSSAFVVFLAPRLAAAQALDTLCGQYSNVVAANFILNNNNWGEGSATSGSQCTYLDYDSGDTIAWQTAWTWEGGQYNVKSYANAGLNIGATLLSSITSMPTTLSWR